MGVILLNRLLYAFFRRQRGVRFALAAILSTFSITSTAQSAMRMSWQNFNCATWVCALLALAGSGMKNLKRLLYGALRMAVAVGLLLYLSISGAIDWSAIFGLTANWALTVGLSCFCS